MATAEELVVAFRSEGAEEAQQKMEGVEGQLEETTDAAADQADQMQEFSTKFRGAMGALVAGLAVAAGGILTQVPVIGEVFSGLRAIFDSVAMGLDQTLRPALSDLSAELFDIAAEMNKEDGILNSLDVLAERLGQLGAESISIALEGDAIATAARDIIKFVFPKLGEGSVLDTIFSFDLSAAAVTAAVFAPVVMTAAKILGVVFGGVTMSGSLILAAIFGGVTITTSMVLSEVFDISLTNTLVLETLFAGVGIAGAAIVGSISWPVIGGGIIVGTLFGGVVITGSQIIDEVFGDFQPGVEPPRQTQATGGPMNVTPRGLSQIGRGTVFASGRGNQTPAETFAQGRATFPRVNLDGRELNERTGRYGRDQTARRGVE